jgi:hypothetical protein
LEYALGEDPIEAMSLITTAIVTNSNITIERCPVDFLELELLKLEKMGFKYKILKRYKGLNGKVNLVDIETRKSTLSALPDKIHAQPYPGINMDNLPFFVAVGAVAHGQSFIHDWVYEERAIYYKEIEKLGAEVILADPHRFYIKGPTLWKKADITCPPALRPSVVIMICMLAVPEEDEEPFIQTMQARTPVLPGSGGNEGNTILIADIPAPPIVYKHPDQNVYYAISQNTLTLYPDGQAVFHREMESVMDSSENIPV